MGVDVRLGVVHADVNVCRQGSTVDQDVPAGEQNVKINPLQVKVLQTHIKYTLYTIDIT